MENMYFSFLSQHAATNNEIVSHTQEAAVSIQYILGASILLEQ